MIDTVALTLDSGYEITDYNAFIPSAKNLFEPPFRRWGGRRTLKSIQNPTKTDNMYKPKLTLSKVKGRGSYPILRVELSLPKLIYQNNLQELSNADFETVVSVLKIILKDMGVETTEEAIKNAKISAIHYSKNTILENGVLCSAIISELFKSDVNSRLDLNWTKYRNHGEIITYHANSYEICFYDKMRDIEKHKISPKRTIDRDKFNVAKDSRFFGKEVLRMEVRLNKRRVIKNLLEKVGHTEELIFKNLFSADIARAVLNHYWNILMGNIPLKISVNNSAEQIFQATKGAGNTGLRLKLTAFILLLQEVGVRPVKRLLNNYLFKSLTHAAEIVKNKGFSAYSPLKGVGIALRQFIVLK